MRIDLKERLDVLLVKKGLVNSRQQAKAVIMAGEVFVNGEREDKAGTTFDEKADIVVKSNKQKYVSRGGFKLEKAINNWPIDLNDKICMDIGSSTGGFTDCMLQNGAKKVYAVDVGTNQLAWSLRSNEKVVSMEKTNIRYLTTDQVNDKIQFASVDVSFISLCKILVPARELLEEKAQMVCLIKPQFEAGREKVGKKGVVRDKKVHVEVIEQVMLFAYNNQFDILEIDYSPIKGPEGNIEYLIYIQKNTEKHESSYNWEDLVTLDDMKDICNKVILVTDEAHNSLD